MCRISRRHPMMGQSILTSRLWCNSLSSLSRLCGHHLNGWLGFSSSSKLGQRAYMAAPADVAAAPATTAVATVVPVSCMDLISRDMNLYGLLYGLVCTTCGCR